MSAAATEQARKRLGGRAAPAMMWPVMRSSSRRRPAPLRGEKTGRDGAAVPHRPARRPPGSAPAGFPFPADAFSPALRRSLRGSVAARGEAGPPSPSLRPALPPRGPGRGSAARGEPAGGGDALASTRRSFLGDLAQESPRPEGRLLGHFFVLSCHLAENSCLRNPFFYIFGSAGIFSFLPSWSVYPARNTERLNVSLRVTALASAACVKLNRSQGLAGPF